MSLQRQAAEGRWRHRAAAGPSVKLPLSVKVPRYGPTALPVTVKVSAEMPDGVTFSTEHRSPYRSEFAYASV
jgi:hypothetical protein